MIRRPWKLAWVPALAVALTLGACGDQAGTTNRLIGPETVSFAKGGNATAKAAKERKGPKVRVKKKDGRQLDYHLVTGYLPAANDANVSMVIDAKGGVLYASGHALIVPAGAVDQRTTFQMRQFRKVLDDSTVVVAVELRARRNGAKGSIVDVGATGFLKPVKLALTYKWSTQVTDANAAQTSIVWLKSDTEAEEVDQTIEVNTADGAKWVIAELEHFSDYALVDF